MAVYTSINDPSQYFQAALYTGNASTNVITNDGNSNLQPDWWWGADRSGTNWNSVYDSSRGVTKQLNTNVNNSEYTVSNGMASFNTDGFTLGSHSNSNTNSNNYVAWQWKANGGTTSTNTDGATNGYNTTVQANQTAGFSIVQWNAAFDQGNGRYNLGHGLGKIPDFILIKNRDASGDWYAHHKDIDDNDYLRLNLDNATSNTSARYTFYRPAFTTSIFNVDYNNIVTQNHNYVAYVFASIQGYSKFDSYTGNGSTDGTFIYTGFKPAWVMIKEVAATGSWHIFDYKRTPNNLANKILYADLTDAEATGNPGNSIDMYSNGFKTRGTGNDTNGDGSTYLYMAFAESPFVSSAGVPTTAR